MSAVGPLVFLAALLAAGAGSFASGAWRPRELEGFLASPWARIGGAVVALQAVATVGVVALQLAGVGTAELAGAVLGFWLLLLAGVVVLPWAVRQDGRADKSTQGFGEWALIAALAVAMCMASFAWFAFAGMFLGMEESPRLAALEASPGFWLLFPFVALGTAAAEEVVFRGGLQPWVAKRLGGGAGAHLGAAALCAGAFALGHAGYAEPFGVKEAQILAVGFAFGWVRWRKGLAAAIVCHGFFNAGVLAVAAAGVLVAAAGP